MHRLCRHLFTWTLASLALTSLAGCEKGKKQVLDNHPTINLFGFEESELHHIHSTVELHRNIFLVRYDPDHPDKLEWINCPITAEYTYNKAAGRRVESMHIASHADLRTRVPVNYARFEAYVSGGKALDFNYITIGSYELMGDFTIPADDPDCARATHYVTTLSVGAFNIAEEVAIEGGVGADVSGTGVGVGLSGGSNRGETTAMGDLQACMNDATAFTDCFTPLQIMMMPLATRHWARGGSSTGGSSTGGSSTGSATTASAQPQASGLALTVDETSWRPGMFMAHALEQVLVVAERINTTTNFGFDDQASTVVAGYLRRGQPQTLARLFEAGQTYAVFATGATAEGNLDLVIRDSNGQVIAADIQPDNAPAVTFVPPQSGSYQLELSVNGRDDEFGAMVIMREGGLGIEAEILQAAFQTLLDNATVTSAKIVELGFPNGLIFHENDWSLLGTVLYPGEVISQPNMRLDANSAVFVGVAHDPTMNIDLEIVEQASGASFADTQPDAHPLVLIDKPNTASGYDLRVIYPRGEGPTLATALILKLSD